MLTGPYFYGFYSKETPGIFTGYAVRFEKIELPMETAKDTEFNLLTRNQKELAGMHLDALKQIVNSNL